MASETKPNFSKWMSEGALYGTDGELRLFWGESLRTPRVERYPCVFSTDFFLEEPAPWTYYESWTDLHSVPLAPKVPHELQWSAPDRARFENDFVRAQDKFKSGEMTKIVLTTQTRAPKTIPPELFIGNALGAIPVNTHVYGQWTARGGFLGYTPEILFRLENANTLTSMALAGTSPISSVETNLHTPKNLKEHELVVEDILAVLDTMGPAQKSKVETLRLKNLAHLHTPLSVHMLKPITLESIIEKLHPTPALGVAPRSKWRELKELRAGYGSFGAPFVSAQSSSHATGVVGIRQLAWDDEYYYIRCGCGVVEDSQLDEEWNELQLKIRSVKALFGWKTP